jgi:hypothetical protein
MPSTNGIIRAADDPPKVTPISSSAIARSDRAGLAAIACSARLAAGHIGHPAIASGVGPAS